MNIVHSDMISRLKKIEGQIRGIQKMIEEQRECHEVVGQLLASRAAIDKVAVLLMDNQVERCLNEKGKDKANAEKLLRETLKTAIKFR